MSAPPVMPADVRGRAFERNKAWLAATTEGLQIESPAFRLRPNVILAIALAASLTGPAAAETIGSAYTTFDLRRCRHERGAGAEDYGAWNCRGYGRQRIWQRAGDQRVYVSYGAAAAGTVAFSETFPGFNDADSGTVEWRIASSPNAPPMPFATILRWNVVTESDTAKAKGPIRPGGRVLVVTRLDPGGVCHVGYVDARANADANALARSLADSRARAFRCGTDTPVVVGTISPGLAMPGSAK